MRRILLLALSVVGLSSVAIPVIAADLNAAAPSPRKREICFFEDREFYGTAKCFQLEDGKRRRAVDAFEDRFDDAVSSLKMGSGVVVEVCENPNGGGDCKVFENTIESTSKSWNDRISSFTVWDKDAESRPAEESGSNDEEGIAAKQAKDKTPGYDFDKKGFIVEDGGNAGAPYACLYNGSSFTGEEFCLWNLGTNNLTKLGFADKTESVRVQRGYQVTLCPKADSPGAACEKNIDRPLEQVSDELLTRIRSVFVEEP